MTEEEIGRINRFVDLKSPKSNKHTIKIDIFLILFLFMFFIGDSLTYNYNLLTSWWMIFAVPACSLIIWSFYLLRNLDKRQDDFLLYWGAVGTYFSVEFFALGISYGINDAHINVILLVLLVLLDVPLLLFLLWYRIQLFKGKKEIQGGSPNYKIMTPLIFIISPILIMIFKNAQSQLQTVFMPLMFIFVGIAFSVSLSCFGNYYVARKYRSYIRLYDENGIIQTGHNKEDGRSAHRNKK